MVTSLLLHSHFSSFFEKPLICTENGIASQVFNQFLPFQNSVLFPVMTELSAKTACRNLFRSRRSSLTETYNLKSDPILLIYIARRRRRTRKYPPRNYYWYLVWNLDFIIFLLFKISISKKNRTKKFDRLPKISNSDVKWGLLMFSNVQFRKMFLPGLASPRVNRNIILLF